KAGNEFLAVDAIASDDVWAVGARPSRTDNRATPLAEHWDGQAWTIVRTPTANQGFFTSVSGATGDDVWAVGYLDHAGVEQTKQLIAHWDGATWTPLVGPDPAGDEELLGVDAIAADDVWAVGWADDGRLSLTEHWDGTSWTIVDSPNPSHSAN